MVIFNNISLLSLPVEDVIFANILPRLEPKDWISLRSSSHSLHRLINSFLTENKSLTVSQSSPLMARTFQILTHCSTKLRHLDLRGCNWLTDDILKPVLRSNPRLSSIDLSYCNNCTEGVLHTITMMCPAITTLRLRGCCWVNSSGLDYLCHQHRKRNQILPIGLEDVLKMMGTNLRTNLKEKKKAKYSGKDQLYLHIMSRQRKLKTQNNCKKINPQKKLLSELDISECDFTIKDETIEKITEVFTHLEVLKVSKNISLTNQTVKAIARNLKHLHTLDLSDCLLISAAGLFTLAKHCKHLRYLNIGSIDCHHLLLKHIRGLRIVVGLVQPMIKKTQEKILEEGITSMQL